MTATKGGLAHNSRDYTQNWNGDNKNVDCMSTLDLTRLLRFLEHVI